MMIKGSLLLSAPLPPLLSIFGRKKRFGPKFVGFRG